MTEELRILKLGLPSRAIIVLDLLVNEIGWAVNDKHLMETAGCSDAMLRNYIKLLRQHGCEIQTLYGVGYRLEGLPGGEEPA